MEKEQNSKPEENINNKTKSPEDSKSEKDEKLKEKEIELGPEEKIKEEGLRKKKMMPLSMGDFLLQENL